jgi:hypothetical protein
LKNDMYEVYNKSYEAISMAIYMYILFEVASLSNFYR